MLLGSRGPRRPNQDHFDLDRQIDRYLTFYTQKKLKSDQDPQAYQGLVMGPSTPPKKYCMIYIKFLFILSGLTLISRVWHRRFHQIIFLVCFEHDHTVVGFLTCMAEICEKKNGFSNILHFSFIVETAVFIVSSFFVVCW